jgi:hypothetical protein
MSLAESAAHRLHIFVDAPGDYINPLAVAYGGLDAYEQAMSAFKADIRAAAQALEESQDGAESV